MAGLKFVRLTLSGALNEPFSFFGEGEMALGRENWPALAPELLWRLWGFALGVGTLAYYRRRGGCGHCVWTGVRVERGLS